MPLETYAPSFAHQVALIHILCSGRSNSNAHSQTMQLNLVKWLEEMGWISCLCALCLMVRGNGQDFLV